MAKEESVLRRFQRGQAALARSAKHDLSREQRRESLLEAKELLGELPPKHETELERLSEPVTDTVRAIIETPSDREELRRLANRFMNTGLGMLEHAMKRRYELEATEEAKARLPRVLAVYGVRTAEAMARLHAKATRKKFNPEKFRQDTNLLTVADAADVAANWRRKFDAAMNAQHEAKEQMLAIVSPPGTHAFQEK